MKLLAGAACFALMASAAHASESCVEHDSSYYNTSLSKILATEGVRNTVQRGRGVCFDKINEARVKAAQRRLDLYFYDVADTLRNICDEASVVAWAKKEGLPFGVRDTFGSNGRPSYRMINIYSTSAAEVELNRKRLALAPRVRECGTGK